MIYHYYYLRRRLASEGIVALGVTLSRCVYVCRAAYITYRLHVALVSAAKVMQCCLVIIVIQSDSASCDRCYRNVVCPSACRMTHSCTPLDGMRCHLTGTFVWSQITLYITQGAPVPHGAKGRNASSHRCRPSPIYFSLYYYYYN